MSLSAIGGEYNKEKSLCPKFMKYCAYLCFSHISYGVAVVPKKLWQQAQKAESALWQDIGTVRYMMAADNSAVAVAYIVAN
jgi:hypothetical protein